LIIVGSYLAMVEFTKVLFYHHYKEHVLTSA
jgi:hypothetical protein